MVSNKALSLVPTQGSEVEWWNMAQQQAGMLVKTGFLPDAIKSPEQAIAIMMKGRELGIPSMYALSNIVIIKGKPTCNSELMLALIYRDHGDSAMRIVESSKDVCKIAYRRAQWPTESVYAFTVQDAQQAGLMTTDTWKKYTAAMLRARCISAVARMAFPDSIAGMYTPEELGAAVEVNDDGEMAVVHQRPRDIYEAIDAGLAPVGVDGNTEELLYLQPPGEERWEGGCTKKQLQRLNIIRQQKGVTADGLKKMHGKTSGKLLTEAEAADLIAQISAFPDIIIDEPDDEFDTGDLPPTQAEIMANPDRWTN